MSAPVFPSSGISPIKLGYIPVSHGFQSHDNEWTLDRLLKTNGVIAIVIGSLVFLSVFTWVDAFNQLYREYVTDPPIHHTHPNTEIAPALSSKQKFLYAFILTVATIVIAYVLLIIWKRFE